MADPNDAELPRPKNPPPRGRVRRSGQGARQPDPAEALRAPAALRQHPAEALSEKTVSDGLADPARDGDSDGAVRTRVGPVPAAFGVAEATRVDPTPMESVLEDDGPEDGPSGRDGATRTPAQPRSPAVDPGDFGPVGEATRIEGRDPPPEGPGGDLHFDDVGEPTDRAHAAPAPAPALGGPPARAGGVSPEWKLPLPPARVESAGFGPQAVDPSFRASPASQPLDLGGSPAAMAEVPPAASRSRRWGPALSILVAAALLGSFWASTDDRTLGPPETAAGEDAGQTVRPRPPSPGGSTGRVRPEGASAARAAPDPARATRPRRLQRAAPMAPKGARRGRTAPLWTPEKVEAFRAEHGGRVPRPDIAPTPRYGAPPPPPRPPALRVRTVPPGAEVWLDDGSVGFTPLFVPWPEPPAGPVELELRLEGYAPETVSVTPDREGQLVVSRVLQPVTPTPGSAKLSAR
jgi:hypothetical protein